MTYLFDQQKAMDALLPLEQQWGGSLAERNARRSAAFEAAAKFVQSQAQAKTRQPPTT